MAHQEPIRDATPYRPRPRTAPRRPVRRGPTDRRYASADSAERALVYQPWKVAKEERTGIPQNYDTFLNDSAEFGVDMAAYGNPNQYASNPNPSGGRGGGGYGGGGGGAPDPALAQNAIKNLYALYNKPDDAFVGEEIRPDDGKLAAQLQAMYGQAQQTGAGAIQQLRAGLQGQQNPYQQQHATPTVAANPMAQYMGASGASTESVDALRAMLGDSALQMRNADQMVSDRSRQSWEGQQVSRFADASTSEAGFAQQLANTKAGYDAQIAAQRQRYVDERTDRNTDRKMQYDQANKKRKDDLMAALLEMAVSNGIDLSALGVSF